MRKLAACAALATLVCATAAFAQVESSPIIQAGRTGGGVDLATFQARHRARLMRADTDRDGRITQAEWSAWWAAHPGKGPVDPARRFRRLDGDGNGVLTAEEFDTAFAKRFARLDADHDGHLTAAERPRGHRPE